MLKSKFTLLTLAISTAMILPAMADDAPAAKAPTALTNTAPAKPSLQKQVDEASKTASFGTIIKTDDGYKSALDAHALDDALKMVGKEGAFKGTVAKVYEPHGLAIVEFDMDYKSALTAIVHGSDFTNFPVLTNLIGKDVLVTGKFIKYRDSAEIVLAKPEQIKLAQ